MTWGKGKVLVMLNCLLIGCATIHANVLENGASSLIHAIDNVQGSASEDSQRITALESRLSAMDSLVESRISAMDSLVTSLRTHLNNRQLELERLVEDIQADVTAKQAQVNTSIGIVQHNVTVMRSRVETINTGLLAKRCEQGTANLQPKNQPTSSNGERRETQHIMFNMPFFGTPKITLGFTYLDTYNWANTRVLTEVTNASPYGFDLSAAEWASSSAHRVKVDWMACS